MIVRKQTDFETASKKKKNSINNQKLCNLCRIQDVAQEKKSE